MPAFVIDGSDAISYNMFCTPKGLRLQWISASLSYPERVTMTNHPRWRLILFWSRASIDEQPLYYTVSLGIIDFIIVPGLDLFKRKLFWVFCGFREYVHQHQPSSYVEILWGCVCERLESLSYCGSIKESTKQKILRASEPNPRLLPQTNKVLDPYHTAWMINGIQ